MSPEQEDCFTGVYGGYEVEFLPYEALQELLDENIDTYGWDAKHLVRRVNEGIIKFSVYDDVLGLQVTSPTAKIYFNKAQKRIRTLLYFCVTGTWANTKYSLRYPSDNYNTFEWERFELYDRVAASRKVGEKLRESQKKVKELLEVV